MIRIATLLVAFIGLSLLLPMSPAAAQGKCSFCDTNEPPKGEGGGRPDNGAAVGISVESDIDFGRLVLVGNGVGQVVIDLQTGEKYVTGGLNDLGGISVQGRAVVTGKAYRAIRVDIPGSALMTDPAGGQAELRDIVTDLPPLPVLDGEGKLVFHFTGTLNTDAATAVGGQLRGRIPIRVSYD